MTPFQQYVAGDDGCGDEICRLLEPSVRAAARRGLAPDDPESDDVVQEVLIGFLRYLRRSGVVPDNCEAFAVTMARNRCRNLYLWRRRRPTVSLDGVEIDPPQPGTSPLEWIDDEERRDLLVRTLARLDDRCRELLHAVYSEERSMEELKEIHGLGSVQAVYYRRDACIRKAQQFLNRMLLQCRILRRGYSQRRAGGEKGRPGEP